MSLLQCRLGDAKVEKIKYLKIYTNFDAKITRSGLHLKFTLYVVKPYQNIIQHLL